MLSNRIFIAAISLCILIPGLSSCRRDNSVTPSDVKEDLKQRTVVFTVSGSDFEVKSTSSAFENGEVIGIFAPDMDKFNVKGTVQGTVLNPETPIRWESGQTASSGFCAYYPYIEDLDQATVSFKVQADQTGAEAYSASDLRASYVYAAPKTTVNFVLKHCFSKLTLNFTSKVSGETVTSVALKELVTDAVVDLATSAPAKGTEKADISAFKQSEGSFCAILIPQPFLNVEVTTSKDRKVTFSTYIPVEMESGCAYKADLVLPELNHETTELEFTVSLDDWTDGGAVPYGDSKQEGL